ncbi:MAG: hypothetical protein N3D11_11620 [Candidatus Sumerlaeia bacterium]|nr:hypothetical protein [Candidatus Sumerlaeia bacterium]
MNPKTARSKYDFARGTSPEIARGAFDHAVALGPIRKRSLAVSAKILGRHAQATIARFSDRLLLGLEGRKEKGLRQKKLRQAQVIAHKSASALECGSHAAAFFFATIQPAKRGFFSQFRRFI